MGKAELVDVAKPKIKEGHVLVETAYTAVSAGTERANLMKMPNTGAYGLPEGERRYDVPLVSTRLGLTGRTDLVIVTADEVIPVDY